MNIIFVLDTQAKEKWKNLRAVFVRHIKPSPSGSSLKTKKPYYLADAMQFTIPYIKTLNNDISGNVPQVGNKEVMEQEVDDEEEEYQSLIRQALTTNRSPSPMSSSLPASSPLFNNSPPPMPYPSPKLTDTDTYNSSTNRRKKNTCSAVDEGIMDYFKTRTEKLQNRTGNVEDSNRMFLLSLQSDMKAMTDSQRRTFKLSVLALVDEIFDNSGSPIAQPPQQATRANTVSNTETEGVLLLSMQQPSTSGVLPTQTLNVPNECNELLTYYESFSTDNAGHNH